MANKIKPHRIITNIFSNWAGMGITIIISIVLTPFLLHRLGTERFGIYSISRQFSTYLFLFDLGIIGAITRFASQYIAEKNESKLSEIVSTSVFLYLGICTVAIIASLCFAIMAPEFFNVSAEYEKETRWMFGGLGIYFAFNLMLYPWKGVLMGIHRFDLMNITMIVGGILNLGLIVLFFVLGYVDLIAVIIAFIISAVIQLILTIFITHHKYKGISISMQKVTRSAAKQIMTFSLWNVLNTLGGVILWSTDTILAGWLLGAKTAAFFAIPFMLIGLGRMAVGGLSQILTPLAAGFAVNNSSEQTKRMLIKSTRFSLLMTIGINCVLIILYKDLITLWIGKDYAWTWIIYAVLMICFWAAIVQLPAYNIILGAGDIRAPSFWMMICGIAAIVGKIAAVRLMGWGVMSIAWASVVFMLPYSLFYMPWRACKMVDMPLWELYRKSYLWPIIAFIPVLIIEIILVRYLPPTNLIIWMVYFAAMAFIYESLGWLTLDADDRVYLLNLITKRPLTSKS